mmetsp:Transcript_20941/g.49403  ORF Transcript_20941/g.49403 Transcript_20941/m.49403 type:complete len:82 (-) Transcript_20941:5450-5695(-)
MLKIGRDYQRPALELFNDHCDMVIDKYRLKNHHFQGRVESIDLCNNNNNNDGDGGGDGDGDGDDDSSQRTDPGGGSPGSFR